MIAFIVTVRTALGAFHYHDVAQTSCDVISDAIDRFGAVAVTVMPEVRHG